MIAKTSKPNMGTPSQLPPTGQCGWQAGAAQAAAKPQ
jgi:hypothetical protein